MARTFNAGIWGDIGDAVARDDMLRRERNQKSLGGLLDAAKFIEKTNANRKLREDWQKYFDDRKASAAAAMAAKAKSAADAAAEASKPVAIDEVSPLMSIFLDDQINQIVPNDMDSSIWGGNGLGGEAIGWNPEKMAAGYDTTLAPDDLEFIQGFNPKTATPEDIVMAQRIVGTDDDGIWGKNSRAAYKKFMGGV